MNFASKSEGDHDKLEDLREGQRLRIPVRRTGKRIKVQMRGTLRQHRGLAQFKKHSLLWY